MRTFSRFVAFRILLALAAGDAVTVPVRAALPRQNSPAPESAATLYAEAATMLRRGRNFEVCIAKLRQAVEKEPKNADYHAALGCALASRVASLSLAEYQKPFLPSDELKYKQLMNEWQKAQSVPTDPQYKQPEPEPPHLITKDDSKSYALATDDALAQITALSDAAKKEWEAALLCAKDDADKAELHYIRGWGLNTLRLFKALLTKKSQYETQLSAGLTADPVIVAEFKEATTLVPDNPAYWQSLGDAYVANLHPRLWETVTLPNTAEAIAAYQQSLLLKPHNLPVQYRIFLLLRGNIPETTLQVTTPTPTPSAKAEEHFEQTAAWLDTILSSSPSNALLWYEKAILWGSTKKATLTEATLQAIEQGNAASQCADILYLSPVPRLLSAAWFYRSIFSSGYESDHYIQDIHSVVMGTLGALQASSTENTTMQIRIGRAWINLGHRMCTYRPVASPLKYAFINLNNYFECSSDLMNGFDILKEMANKNGDRTALKGLAIEEGNEEKCISPLAKIIREEPITKFYQIY